MHSDSSCHTRGAPPMNRWSTESRWWPSTVPMNEASLSSPRRCVARTPGNSCGAVAGGGFEPRTDGAGDLGQQVGVGHDCQRVSGNNHWQHGFGGEVIRQRPVRRDMQGVRPGTVAGRGLDPAHQGVEQLRRADGACIEIGCCHG